MEPGSYTVIVKLTDDVGGTNTFKLIVIATSPTASYIIKEDKNLTNTAINSTANITVTKDDEESKEEKVTAKI